MLPRGKLFQLTFFFKRAILHWVNESPLSFWSEHEFLPGMINERNSRRSIYFPKNGSFLQIHHALMIYSNPMPIATKQLAIRENMQSCSVTQLLVGQCLHVVIAAQNSKWKGLFTQLIVASTVFVTNPPPQLCHRHQSFCLCKSKVQRFQKEGRRSSTQWCHRDPLSSSRPPAHALIIPKCFIPPSQDCAPNLVCSCQVITQKGAHKL